MVISLVYICCILALVSEDSNCYYWILLGPGVLPNMGNTGRITNSIGGLVGGANASRGASSTGVGNIPGLASRLNLAGISLLLFDAIF